MEEKKLIASIFKTPDETILWSRFTHDCVIYEDANGETYLVDGGTSYQRTSVNKEPMKNLSIYDDSPYSIIRVFYLWGTFQKDSFMKIPISQLSNEHLSNIIKDGYENPYIKKELKYRKEHNINIPEYEYCDTKSICRDYKFQDFSEEQWKELHFASAKNYINETKSSMKD